MLIEALIGVVLMAIIGMGITYVTSRATVSQRDMQLQELAVNQMRELLLKNRSGVIDICADTPKLDLPNLPPIVVEYQNCSKVTATINGVAIPDIPRPVIIRAQIPTLGWIVVGGNWS